MKIYILGISGMLGSELFLRFSKISKYIVKGSARAKHLKFFNEFKNNIDYNVSAYNLSKIKKNIKKFKPDYVLNCIGFVKQKIKNSTKLEDVFYINSIFPKKIFKITKSLNIKLIHFSTDCVFDGSKGNYDEKSIPNARDVYGLSKYLGELNNKHVLTIRTSILGHELSSKHGLIEWFLSQKKKCNGYINVFFSGMTTFEIFNFFHNYILIKKKKNLYGLYNLSSRRISKYALLKKISKVYKKNILIKKDYNSKLDRTLNSSLVKKKTSYKSPSWNKMLNDMYKNSLIYLNNKNY
jgi:dTDP-4-dehydrorhamnose reductase